MFQSSPSKEQFVEEAGYGGWEANEDEGEDREDDRERTVAVMVAVMLARGF